MSGRRGYAFHEGDRSEYLVTSALSSIAAVVPIPRQEDYGLDQICALTCREGSSLYIKEVFGVQTKSSSVNQVPYGGLDKERKWKEWEIIWLFNQNYPLMIASVDKKTWQIQLYSTNRMWRLRWKKGWSCQLNMLVKEDSKSLLVNDVGQYQHKEVIQSIEPCGDGQEWTIPLGPPVIDVKIRDLEEEEFRKKIFDCLEYWVQLENKNIIYHHLKVPFCVEVSNWKPNEIPNSNNTVPWYFSNTGEGMNINEIFSSIAPMIKSLVYNFKDQGQQNALKSINPFLKFLKEEGFING